MWERTGTLVKSCKGHVNDSSRHANSIFSLSEEHQALAGTKMRLLHLQQPVLLHNTPHPHNCVKDKMNLSYTLYLILSIVGV